MADRKQDEVGALVYFRHSPGSEVCFLETPLFGVVKTRDGTRVDFYKKSFWRNLLRRKTPYQKFVEDFWVASDPRVLQEFEVPWRDLENLVRAKNSKRAEKITREAMVKLIAGDLISQIAGRYHDRYLRLFGREIEGLEEGRDGYDRHWSDTTPDSQK